MDRRTGLLLGLLLAVGLSVGGCGQGSGPAVATANSAAAPTGSPAADGLTDQEHMLKFAQCMREHGIDMPDPEMNGKGGIGISINDGADPTKVDAAMRECKQYMPNGGEPPKMDPDRLEQLRKLAVCMRNHGVPDFPDPTDQGIQIDGNTSGLNPTDPKFQAAQAACSQYEPKGPDGETGGTGGSLSTQGDDQ